ncbi:MAG: hypothetical protein ACI9GW_000020 [Halieaceae bacterium]|jgi:hypothetical protein
MHETQLNDHVAICETKARYCRTLDTKDWEGYTDVFTEHLVLDTTPAGGYEVHGRVDAVRLVQESLDNANTVHHVHSPEIRIDKDTAEVIWAMQDRVVWSPGKAEKMGNQGHTGYGHYHERYVRCPDGRWRISHLRLTRLHVDVHPGTTT